MTILIKQWRNKTASLMLESGEMLWTFSSVAEAEKACQHWMRSLQSNRQRHHLSKLALYDKPNSRFIA